MNAAQRTYEEQIKRIVKQAMVNGIVWTDKQFAQINVNAIHERAAETARELYGAHATQEGR